MNLPYRQRGFAQLLAQLVIGLIVLALAARFIWWVATEENFDQVAAILWAIGFGIAYFITLGNFFVLRMPAGFGVFILVGLASLPLSWQAGSRVALLALLAAQLAFSFYAGRVISGRLRARSTDSEEEAALQRGGDLVADFGHWVLLSFGALMFLLVGPLIVLLVVTAIVDLPRQEMKWLAAAWGLFAIIWFARKFGAVQWRRVPVCAGIYLLVTGGILVADALAGPFVEGTGLQVAYTTLPGALIAAFVEVFVLRGSGITKSI